MIDTEKYIKVVSVSFTCNHWVDIDKSTKKTLCGLSRRHWWSPMAAFFNASSDCKKCIKIAERQATKRDTKRRNK